MSSWADKIHFMGDGNLGPRGGKLYVFHCPGCGYGHPFEVDAPNGAGWNWNGSLGRPTFTPSLLVNKDYPERRCHSFVTDGKIQFLSDCWHPLADKTVEIPDWDA
jgi:hypothetical protein